VKPLLKVDKRDVSPRLTRAPHHSSENEGIVACELRPSVFVEERDTECDEAHPRGRPAATVAKAAGLPQNTVANLLADPGRSAQGAGNSRRRNPDIGCDLSDGGHGFLEEEAGG
jgi:hypothetical protein